MACQSIKDDIKNHYTFGTTIVRVRIRGVRNVSFSENFPNVQMNDLFQDMS